MSKKEQTETVCQKYCPLCDKYKTISEIKQCEVRKAREKYIERMARK